MKKTTVATATNQQAEWITTPDTARLLGVGRKGFERIAANARLRVRRYPGSKSVLYHREDLMRLREQSEGFSNEGARQ